MFRDSHRSLCARRLHGASGLFLSAVMSLVFLPVLAEAATIDLTTAGSSGSINGALYEQITPQATGTGVFDAFVQQSPPGNANTSHAYNTTENNVLDNGSSDQHNHSIVLGEVPTVDRGGTLHLAFALDINEPQGGGGEFISLDEVQIFVGGTANSSVSSFTGAILDHDGTLVYQMDANEDSWVALDASLNSGSGSGDMLLLVPSPLFAAFAASDVVTLYSQFGLQGVDPAGFTGNFGAAGGFEEWGIGVIPEPSSFAMLLIGLALWAMRRRG